MPKASQLAKGRARISTSRSSLCKNPYYCFADAKTENLSVLAKVAQWVSGWARREGRPTRLQACSGLAPWMILQEASELNTLPAVIARSLWCLAVISGDDRSPWLRRALWRRQFPLTDWLHLGLSWTSRWASGNIGPHRYPSQPSLYFLYITFAIPPFVHLALS